MAKGYRDATNLTANGSTPPITYKGDGLVYYIDGVFNGCTVTIESSQGISQFTEVSGTSKFSWPINMVAAGMDVRATVSDAGASTDISIRTFEGGAK